MVTFLFILIKFHNSTDISSLLKFLSLILRFNLFIALFTVSAFVLSINTVLSESMIVYLSKAQGKQRHITRNLSADFLKLVQRNTKYI